MALNTHDKEVNALIKIINEQPASHLLSIPGIWEILSEHYNNEIMEEIEENKEED